MDWDRFFQMYKPTTYHKYDRTKDYQYKGRNRRERWGNRYFMDHNTNTLYQQPQHFVQDRWNQQGPNFRRFNKGSLDPWTQKLPRGTAEYPSIPGYKDNVDATDKFGYRRNGKRLRRRVYNPQDQKTTIDSENALYGSFQEGANAEFMKRWNTNPQKKGSYKKKWKAKHRDIWDQFKAGQE